MRFFNGRLGQNRKDLTTAGAVIIMNIQPAYPQKFFLYARKSTDVEDKQVLSIEGQLAELREFALKEKLQIIEEFIEKQTAKIPGRPIFNSLLNRVEKGEANGILAWHPDRLARNSVDGGRVIFLLDMGKLQTLKFPAFWFESTPQGKFMLQIAFGQSKYYVDSLSENTKRGLRQKVRRGEYPSLAPIGYLNDVRAKKIVVDQVKGPIIKQIFQMYATGNYTLEALSLFLAQNGIKSRGNKLIKQDRVSYILSDPIYYGHFRFGGEIYSGIHEPIITKKLFDKVKEILLSRSKPWSRCKKIGRVPKAFTGLMRCGECGMMITAEVKKGHTYYRCTKKNLAHKCLQPYTREEEVDRQLSTKLQKISLSESESNEMLGYWKKDNDQAASDSLTFVAQKKEEIKIIDQKLQFILDSYIDQTLDRPDYLKKKADLMGKKKTLEEQVFNQQQRPNTWLEPFKSWILEARDAAKIAGGSNFHEKKVLAGKVFGSNLSLFNQTVRGEGQNVWAALGAAPPSRSMVARTGFEPVICWMRTSCPGPLDERAKKVRLDIISDRFIIPRLRLFSYEK